ncbi:MAG: hypothetical protein DMD86_14950 [Candidatus Rokuibacteriota bacterium]|nr:MAG: hypothetical protein DMD86_14950 [Candidatus Rokubacteria bacterium]
MALMKLISLRSMPGAATPAVIGHSVATAASVSATPRRQNARVRASRPGGRAPRMPRIVNPENTVSSTTARDRQLSRPPS